MKLYYIILYIVHIFV